MILYEKPTEGVVYNSPFICISDIPERLGLAYLHRLFAQGLKAPEVKRAYTIEIMLKDPTSLLSDVFGDKEGIWFDGGYMVVYTAESNNKRDLRIVSSDVEVTDDMMQKLRAVGIKDVISESFARIGGMRHIIDILVGRQRVTYPLRSSKSTPICDPLQMIKGAQDITPLSSDRDDILLEMFNNGEIMFPRLYDRGDASYSEAPCVTKRIPMKLSGRYVERWIGGTLIDIHLVDKVVRDDWVLDMWKRDELIFPTLKPDGSYGFLHPRKGDKREVAKLLSGQFIEVRLHN